MKTVSRREFVATAVAVGAGAMLRLPAFASENQSRRRHIQTCGPGGAAGESIPDEECETLTGCIQRGCGSEPEVFEDASSRTPASYVPPDCWVAFFRGALRRLGKA